MIRLLNKPKVEASPPVYINGVFRCYTFVGIKETGGGLPDGQTSVGSSNCISRCDHRGYCTILSNSRREQ
jgi:hypothetical protein